MRQQRCSSLLLLVFVALILLGACVAERPDAFQAPAPPGLLASKDEVRSGRYPDTNCVRFHSIESDSEIGFICKSKSFDLLENAGVFKSEGLSENDSPVSPAFHVGTPMAMYEMSAKPLRGRLLYTADVDCDVTSGEIYRATATCLVAIMPLDNDEFVYSNFIAESHVDQGTYPGVSDILSVWQTVQPIK